MPPSRTRKEPLLPDQTRVPYSPALASTKLPKSVPAYLLTTPPVFKSTFLPAQKAIDLLAIEQSQNFASSDTTFRCAIGYARETGAWYYPSSTLSSSSPLVNPEPYTNVDDYYPPLSFKPSGESLAIRRKNIKLDRKLNSRANGENSTNLPTLTPKKRNQVVVRPRAGSLILDSPAPAGPARSTEFEAEFAVVIPDLQVTPVRPGGSLIAKPPKPSQ